MLYVDFKQKERGGGGGGVEQQVPHLLLCIHHLPPFVCLFPINIKHLEGPCVPTTSQTTSSQRAVQMMALSQM